MNTPSHALMGCALVGSRPMDRLWPAFIGGILPDLPIYGFYVYEKLVLRVPEQRIWSQDYFSSSIQATLDSLHSFPLLSIVLLGALAAHTNSFKRLSLSMMLHACADFPLHHDDAHRQFFPFSGFRFASPVSYWDPRHHGAWGASLEFVVTGFAVFILVKRHEEARTRAAWIALWALNLLPFLYWGA